MREVPARGLEQIRDRVLQTGNGVWKTDRALLRRAVSKIDEAAKIIRSLPLDFWYDHMV